MCSCGKGYTCTGEWHAGSHRFRKVEEHGFRNALTATLAKQATKVKHDKIELPVKVEA